MTITGYPTAKQPVDVLQGENLEKVIAEHFGSSNVNYKDAIDSIRTAMDTLEDSAKDIDAAAKAVEGTTHGYQLQNAANEIREEITFLGHLQERMRRMA